MKPAAAVCFLDAISAIRIYASRCVALALWRGVGHLKPVTRFGV